MVMAVESLTDDEHSDNVVDNSSSSMRSECVPAGMQAVWTSAGFRMVVLTGGDIVSDSLRARGYWDISQPSQLLSPVPGMTLPPSGIFLDIGGNIGYFSLLFANAGYDVMMIEPMTQNRKAFEASLCLNPHLRDRIKVHPVALVSPADTSMKCVIKPTNTAINRGNGFLTCGSAEDVGACDAPCEEVLVKTLDALLAEASPSNISVVKMDIEKYECRVLAGGQSLFQRFHPQVVRAETKYCGSHCFEEAAAKYGYRVVPNGAETILVAN
jgi:FkbM family methyltransferase